MNEPPLESSKKKKTKAYLWKRKAVRFQHLEGREEFLILPACCVSDIYFYECTSWSVGACLGALLRVSEVQSAPCDGGGGCERTDAAFCSSESQTASAMESASFSLLTFK